VLGFEEKQDFLLTFSSLALEGSDAAKSSNSASDRPDGTG
jgi:hypothetical protein